MNEPSPKPGSSEGKGKSVMVWAGVGCGTILVIAVVCISMLVGFCKKKFGEFAANPEKAAAEMVLKYHPELEMISQDDEKGEMTIRTKDGKEMTMSYKDVSKGIFTIKDAEGNVMQVGETDLSNVPAWVPQPGGVKSHTGAVHSQEADRVYGIFNVTTAEPVQAVEAHFKSEAEKLNMGSSSSSSAAVVDGVETRMLSFEGNGKKLSVIISAKAGEDTQVNVSYEESK